MVTEFKKVTPGEINILAKLAHDIWNEYWGIILSQDQIDYMVEKFQSQEAIKKQNDEENYTYYFIDENNRHIGYFGISEHAGYLFLSKLYISKGFRRRGIGGKAFEKIKNITAEKGYSEIRLTVNKHNKNTIKAYKKWGLTIIDSAVTDIGQGFVMDDYIMGYKL